MSERRTIQVDRRGSDGPVDVKAVIVGPFGVHPTLTFDGFSPVFWTITHVATGLAIVTSRRDFGDAFGLANWLVDTIDWSRFGPCASRPTREDAKKVRAAIERYEASP